MIQERESPELHIYTNDEIEILLSGDRRSIDRLMMLGINNLAIAMLPHMRWEEKILSSLGTPDEISARVAWINSQITQQHVRNDMMRKITESSMVWAFIAFLGFLAFSVWEYVSSHIRLGK